MNILTKIINSKKIYIFEDHNIAPLPWFRIKKRLNSIPALITLDHHTDTHLAFLREITKEHDPTGLNFDFLTQCLYADKMCENIKNEDDILKLLFKLKNDEHIDFSIRTGIISHAYIISNQTNPMFVTTSEEEKQWFKEKRKPENLISKTFEIPRPIGETYKMPKNRMIQLDHGHFDDKNICSEKTIRDHALSDFNLGYRIEEIKRINASIFNVNYDVLENFILDIDLDYFTTLNSIVTTDCNVFYQLIKRSKGITIAKESWFVNSCKLENEKIDSDILLKHVLQHIKNATN